MENSIRKKKKIDFSGGKHEKKYWIILKRMESSCPSKERNRKGPDDQNM